MERKRKSAAIVIAALIGIVSPLAAEANVSVKTGGVRLSDKSHFVEIIAEMQANGHCVGTLHGFSHEPAGFVAAGMLVFRDASGNLLCQIPLSGLGVNGEFWLSSGSDRVRAFDYTLTPEVAARVARIEAVPMEGDQNVPDLIERNVGSGVGIFHKIFAR